MRLYLSSHSFESQSLSDFYGPSPRIGLIANALDFLPPSPRAEAVASTHNSLSELGDVTEIDLRRYFRRPGDLALREDIEQVDALWLPGGSCFLLAAALELSGAATIIAASVRARGLNYAGSSAGAVVASTNLGPATTCEDPQIVRQRYRQAPTYTGLCFLDASVIPHFVSEETEGMMPTYLMRDYCLANEIDYIPITDGNAIVIDRFSVTEITFHVDAPSAS
jgi:dipeptidase E